MPVPVLSLFPSAGPRVARTNGRVHVGVAGAERVRGGARETRGAELDGNIITFEAPSKAAQKTDRPKGRKIEGI